jgi:tRNA-specific 2-thiouridylase
VDCNKHIKFGKLFEAARELGCEYLATGHYARIEYSAEKDRWLLARGDDASKDQSYMLFNMTQDQLAHTVLPLAELTKAEIRSKADETGLAVAHKSDSQDICFVPDGDYAAFIERITGAAPVCGDYIGLNGKVLGRHKGQLHYTIGQRKGLGIALGEPMYVVRIDAEKNQVVLGRKEDLLTQTCYARDLNMMKFPDFIDGQTVMAKVRYKSRPGLAHIYHVDESELQTLNVGTRYVVSDDPKGQNNSSLVRIVFEDPIESITPGQSVVFYCGDNYTDVLAGAILI